ncbi:MAG: ArdC-like ssDNA-binding domain-containing protein, partial [Methylocystis silviterrae]
ASGKHYNGVNVLALWVAALHQGYAQPIWGTYRQWQEKGCQVRKGEKSSLVVFYKTFTIETDREDAAESETSERLFARASYVFNADQVEGYAAPEEALPATPLFSPIEEAERFLAATGARVTESGTKSCYRPSTDDILMPERTRFVGSETMSAGEAFYATLMHELALDGTCLTLRARSEKSLRLGSLRNGRACRRTWRGVSLRRSWRYAGASP